MQYPRSGDGQTNDNGYINMWCLSGGVRPSVAKITIFIVIHGPGCVGSEVADEAYPGPEGSGAVGAGQRCWQSWGSGEAACPGFAHFPLVFS